MLPRDWKFENELLHKRIGLRNKMLTAPFGSKEPEQYSEKKMEIKKYTYPRIPPFLPHYPKKFDFSPKRAILSMTSKEEVWKLKVKNPLKKSLL